MNNLLSTALPATSVMPHITKPTWFDISFSCVWWLIPTEIFWMQHLVQQSQKGLLMNRGILVPLFAAPPHYRNKIRESLLHSRLTTATKVTLNALIMSSKKQNRTPKEPSVALMVCSVHLLFSSKLIPTFNRWMSTYGPGNHSSFSSIWRPDLRWPQAGHWNFINFSQYIHMAQNLEF